MPINKHNIKSDSDDSDSSDVSFTKPDMKKVDDSSQKRRGRPKKINSDKKIVVKQVKKVVDEPLEKELILHIPLYDEDDSSSEKNIFTMKDTSELFTNNKIKNLTDSFTDDRSTESELSVKKLVSELKKANLVIKKLRENTKDSYDAVITQNNESKKTNINLNLIHLDKDGNIVISDKTSIACWWCTYNFDSSPCFLPDRYYSGKYYVFGCFCSYNCVLAYNEYDVKDYRTNLRKSLIKQMYAQISGSDEVLLAARRRELLKKFGGKLTIEEFRSKSLLFTKDIKMKIPPCVPLLLTVEEKDNDYVVKKPFFNR